MNKITTVTFSPAKFKMSPDIFKINEKWKPQQLDISESHIYRHNIWDAKLSNITDQFSVPEADVYEKPYIITAARFKFMTIIYIQAFKE